MTGQIRWHFRFSAISVSVFMQFQPSIVYSLNIMSPLWLHQVKIPIVNHIIWLIHCSAYYGWFIINYLLWKYKNVWQCYKWCSCIVYVHVYADGLNFLNIFPHFTTFCQHSLSTFCQHWPNTATDIIVYVKTVFEVSEYTKAYRKLNILTF